MARAVNGKNYMLDGKDKWVEYTGSGGGGGGGPEDAEPIPDGDIEHLFD